MSHCLKNNSRHKDINSKKGFEFLAYKHPSHFNRETQMGQRNTTELPVFNNQKIISIFY